MILVSPLLPGKIIRVIVSMPNFSVVPTKDMGYEKKIQEFFLCPRIFLRSNDKYCLVSLKIVTDVSLRSYMRMVTR